MSVHRLGYRNPTEVENRNEGPRDWHSLMPRVLTSVALACAVGPSRRHLIFFHFFHFLAGQQHPLASATGGAGLGGARLPFWSREDHASHCAPHSM